MPFKRLNRRGRRKRGGPATLLSPPGAVGAFADGPCPPFSRAMTTSSPCRRALVLRIVPLPVRRSPFDSEAVSGMKHHQGATLLTRAHPGTFAHVRWYAVSFGCRPDWKGLFSRSQLEPRGTHAAMPWTSGLMA